MSDGIKTAAVAAGVVALVTAAAVSRLDTKTGRPESASIAAAREHMASRANATSAKPDGCACSSGKDCEQWVHAIPEAKRDEGWAPAVMGNVLGLKKWQGSGCIEIACTEETLPKECAQ